MKAGIAGFFGENMYLKEKLRQRQKEVLKIENIKSRQLEEQALYEQLFQTPDWQTARSIAITLSMDFELNTHPIIIAAWQENKRVMVPKIVNKKMIFVTIDSNTLYTSGSMSIKEPISSDQASEDIDLVIVPGLAFTKDGKRLGFGAGYYDRFLKQYVGHTVSLSLADQLFDDLPTELHDEIVQQVLYV